MFLTPIPTRSEIKIKMAKSNPRRPVAMLTDSEPFRPGEVKCVPRSDYFRTPESPDALLLSKHCVAKLSVVALVIYESKAAAAAESHDSLMMRYASQPSCSASRSNYSTISECYSIQRLWNSCLIRRTRELLIITSV